MDTNAQKKVHAAPFWLVSGGESKESKEMEHPYILFALVEPERG